MKTYVRIIALAVAGILTFGCTACNKPGGSDVPGASGKPGLPAEPTFQPQTAIGIYVPKGTGVKPDGLPSEAFVDSANAFASALIDQMGENWTGALSPLSLQFALTLLANGAEGTVLSDMLKALGTERNLSEANANTAKLIGTLLRTGIDASADKETSGKGCIFNIANAILAGADDKFTESFKAAAADYFSASIGNIDFANPEEALRIINEWASDQTNGLVDKLFEEIPSDVCTALLSAVCFKGNWDSPFTADGRQSTFRGANGDTPVTMLGNTGKYLYGSFETGEMILLPYEGGEFYMAVVLPREGVAPAAAMSKLMGKWDECTEHGCEFSMPAVSLDTNIDARGVLSEMGFADVAGGNALFPSIIEGSGIQITQIVHGAHINVTETGTEAGAAAGVTGKKSPCVLADIVMKCDRPYAMAIVNSGTGAVVFVSVVNDIDGVTAIIDRNK